MRPELERRLAVLVEPLGRAVLDGVREFEAEPDRVRVELGLIPVFVDERPLVGLAGLLDWRSSGRLSATVRSNFFTGAWTEQLLMPGERRWPVDRLVMVGAGARADFNEARARELGSRCVEIATGLVADSVLIALPSASIERGLVELVFDSLLEAISRGVHHASEQAPQASSDGVDEPTAQDPSDGPEALELDPALESQPEEGIEEGIEAGKEAIEGPQPRWWVVADESVVLRLRRVRSGPPRAARGGPSLYT